MLGAQTPRREGPVTLLSKRLDSPRTVAITGTVLQAAVWAYVTVLIASAYDRHIIQPESPTGEFYGEVYGIIYFTGSLSLIGFLISVDAAARNKYRGRWFFWASFILSAPLCLLYPVGTVLGLGFIIYLCILRKEFRSAIAKGQGTNQDTSSEN